LRPLIPRVRVGDVLKGTKNLRNYLQTASTLNYLNNISQGMSPNKRNKKTMIYRASKDERFLVTVNAWGTFGAYSLDTDVILLFSNPSAVSSGRGKNYLPPRLMHGNARMDPTIFSQWFIRTPYKQTNLMTWDDHAYYMWVSLHLNMQNIRHDNAPKYHWQNGSTGPFNARGGGYGMPSRQNLQALLPEWIVRGVTRRTASTGKNQGYGGCGPRLEEAIGMREEIRQLCSNPRVAEHMKSEQNYVYQAFIQANK